MATFRTYRIERHPVEKDEFEHWALKVRRDRIMKPLLGIAVSLAVLGAIAIVTGVVYWLWHDPAIVLGARIGLTGLVIGIFGGIAIPVLLSFMESQ
jgi:hypothetical protein